MRKTKPYECWDNKNVGDDNPQIQNEPTPEDAVASFGHQFEIERDCYVFVRDPDDLLSPPKKYLLHAERVSEFEYSASLWQ